MQVRQIHQDLIPTNASARRGVVTSKVGATDADRQSFEDGREGKDSDSEQKYAHGLY